VVSVRLGLPIKVTGRTLEERDTLISVTRAAVQALLESGPIEAD